MSTIFKQYLKNIENSLKAGNATEHTHRPALKMLLEELDPSIIATNEPQRIACGAPDYIVTRADFSIGYIEAKDVGKSLHEIERGEQLKRYKRALSNLILTDYLEFRWYVDGELRQEARLARSETSGKLKNEKGGIQAVEELLNNFLTHKTEAVNSPKDLAERMAKLTHIIRDIIITAFETGQASNLLQGWREAFAEVLIADLGQPERTADFADMVSQTLAYGLFSARVMDTTPENFSRHEAQNLIPKSNPFLRRFFSKITSVELNDEPFAPFVDDLVNLLANTDMSAVLADFGKRTRQEDPIVHFYETFLAAYDPKLRESRGVYYTPEPVVSYIVRSVDYLLKTRFDSPQGLADSTKIKIPNYDPSLKVKGKKDIRKEIESHKVIILDPATGTGTFLYAVIDHIRQQFIDAGNAGMWAGYVKNHLLPRLFGFELLMAPYAVAHFKLSLQLAGRDLPDPISSAFSYIPSEGERLGIYLTDALEEAHEMTGLPLFTQWVSDETIAANQVKRHLPVLVVMGNPPYSVSSSNKGKWIESLMETYKKAVRGERNIQPLSDDYVKFIRFAHDRVERTKQGVVAIITNHAYLFGPVHRG
ncbi:MAG: DNA methyltransferase, partial [Anaerolineae bacterium]|nr:DNA methyltransferase [Anaerolineae bacterium]